MQQCCRGSSQAGMRRAVCTFTERPQRPPHTEGPGWTPSGLRDTDEVARGLCGDWLMGCEGVGKGTVLGSF